MTNRPTQQDLPLGYTTTPAHTPEHVRPTRKAASLNIARAVKVAMNEDVRNCGHSREQIVDRMNEMALDYGVSLVNGNAKKLTLDTFEKWLNPNDLTRQIPIKAVPIFCIATGGCSIIHAIVEPLGIRVIGGKEIDLLIWAEAKAAIKINNRIASQAEKRIF